MSYVFQQRLLPKNKYALKAPYTMQAEGICVHNTAMDAPADNEVKYHNDNNNQVSYHVAIDDKKVIQCLPFNRSGFHAGDGAKGDGNRKHIGIEICYSKSGGSRYVAAEENAVQYIAKLLHERNWDVKHVKKHQDFSGKYCPHRILAEDRWDSFIKRIDVALQKLKAPEKCTLHFTSSTLKSQLDTRLASPASHKLVDAAAVKHLGNTSKLDNGTMADGDFIASCVELAVFYAKKDK